MARVVTTITATSTGQTAGNTAFTWLGGRLKVTAYGSWSSKAATLKTVVTSTLSIALTTAMTANDQVTYENVPPGTSLVWNTSGAAASALSVTGICESV